LSPEQIADLVEFLMALPYEDAETQAASAGLIQVGKQLP
jgi:hypothetical protein